jgi:hypothetical protein
MKKEPLPLKPSHRLCIQVVGGLIQQQDVWGCQQEAAKCHTATLTCQVNTLACCKQETEANNRTQPYTEVVLHYVFDVCK